MALPSHRTWHQPQEGCRLEPLVRRKCTCTQNYVLGFPNQMGVPLPCAVPRLWCLRSAGGMRTGVHMLHLAALHAAACGWNNMRALEQHQLEPMLVDSAYACRPFHASPAQAQCAVVVTTSLYTGCWRTSPLYGHHWAPTSRCLATRFCARLCKPGPSHAPDTPHFKNLALCSM